LTTSLFTGSWYHTAFTYDGTTVKLYLNGEEVGAQSFNLTPNSNKNIPLRIGATSGSVDRYFNGKIEDVRLYKRVLTPTEVKLLAK
jgi:hypothetical protein